MSHAASVSGSVVLVMFVVNPGGHLQQQTPWQHKLYTEHGQALQMML